MTVHRRRVILALLALALIVVLNRPQPLTLATAQIAVRDPWAPAAQPIALQQPGAAYVTVENHGHSADRLIGASSTVAGRVELRGAASADNAEGLGSLAIPPGATVSLQPGGPHLMLMELTQPLEGGSRFPLRLSFARAGDILVTVHVRGAAGRARKEGTDRRCREAERALSC